MPGFRIGRKYGLELYGWWGGNVSPLIAAAVALHVAEVEIEPAGAAAVIIY